jgi:hypothetical protein
MSRHLRMLARKQLQAEIPGHYRWYVHVGLDLLMAGAVVTFAASHLDSPTLAELSAIPIAFLTANLGEYLLHRYPMHCPGISRAIYYRHTVCHHSFFTDTDMGIDSMSDLRWVLFPAVTVPLLVLLMVPVALVVGAAVSPNAGFLSLIVTASYYLFYEFLHTAYHVRSGSWLGKNRAIAHLRGLHQSHHDRSLMSSSNFNITFPIFDALLGTRARQS